MADSKKTYGRCQKWIREVAATFEGDECLIWPFRSMKNGYGSIYDSGKPTTANRLVCRLVHGYPEEPSLQAAHSCGNKLCVNPSHIRWATRSENEQDKRIHGTYGTRKGGAKLTPRQVSEIRRIGRTKKLKEIGAQFGITPATVSSILLRRHWQDVR